MKRLVLLSIVLGAAVPACQATIQPEPVYTSTATTTRRPPPPPRERPVVERRWVPLAEAYSADSERQFINLIGRGGEFRKLRLEGVRGAPVITRVAVEFMDREMQVVDLNARLSRGEGQVIDLNGRGRAINRIIVYAEPQYGGRYSVFGT